MCNSKLGKQPMRTAKTWSICYNFTHKMQLVMNNLANKAVEWRGKKRFCRQQLNNSRMSTTSRPI